MLITTFFKRVNFDQVTGYLGAIRLLLSVDRADRSNSYHKTDEITKQLYLRRGDVFQHFERYYILAECKSRFLVQ